MRMTEQQAIRAKAATIMVEWANGRKPTFDGESPDDLKDAITAAHLVADEGRIELQRWIDAARRTGLSWSEIGETLGISKQAAQQRFKATEPDEEAVHPDGEKIVRLGATAFNEMRILREEGAKGYELVDTGVLKLVFRPTDRKWEYRRSIGGNFGHPENNADGWIYVSSWLPFHYFKRAMES